MKPSLCRVWYSRMIVLVPLELTEYDYEYNNDPRNTLHAAGPSLPTDAVIADGGCSRKLVR